ncbi:MAG: undecaprenyl-diphosphate phosphatase [Acidimicrobiales bacterium]
MGVVQGVTELFPVSSLGHGVLIPALLRWHNLVGSQSVKQSFFLVFLVAVHV